MTFDFACENPVRLDLFLREKIALKLNDAENASNSKIRRLIIAGAVKTDGRQCRIPSFMLRSGCRVSVVFDEAKFFFEKQPDDVKFEVTEESVLYEDDVIIVLNKPAFFPSEPTITGKRDNMHDAVVRWLWKRNPSLRNPPYAGIMHRLDCETSGVILFTKQRTVNNAVHDMFENHTARKVYRAVTVRPAKLPSHEFSADTFTGRISAKSAAAKWGELPESRGGVHAHTDFTLIELSENKLFIEARPLTGRTHQIRVHLSSLGMPIIGDTLYGAPAGDRMYLHAQSLTFPHPVTGRIMTITSPLPSGFFKE